VYHRLPQRIRADAAICFNALIMFRIMRTRLHTSKTRLSLGSTLAVLSRIQRHDVMFEHLSLYFLKNCLTGRFTSGRILTT
jgi:hypothetical protein